LLFLFFFQAEDGIRDRNVTGVQTCALPIYQLCPFICMIIFRHMFLLPFPFYTKIKSASRNEKADCSIVLCFYFFSNFNCTFCLVFNRCFYFFGQSTLYCCC